MPSFPIIVDTQFAENVSTKGNRCGVTFSPPLQIPTTANPRLRLYSSSFAYNFPNVSTEFENNTLVTGMPVLFGRTLIVEPWKTWASKAVSLPHACSVMLTEI